MLKIEMPFFFDDIYPLLCHELGTSFVSGTVGSCISPAAADQPRSLLLAQGPRWNLVASCTFLLCCLQSFFSVYFHLNQCVNKHMHSLCEVYL